MDTSTTEGAVDTSSHEADGGADSQAETITISKADYDKTNQTLGSLKRELKDLKKPKEDTKETAQQTKADDNSLLSKAYLRSAGITGEDEVDLALATAKKWDVSIDKLVDDEDFKIKLEKLRNQKANEIATSGVKGGGGKTSQAKETSEYWVAKGTPPTPADVPNRAVRQKIVQEMIKVSKNNGKTFYND